MLEQPISTTSSTENKQRLLALFGRLLPLVDGIADKLRFVLVIGVLSIAWVGVWLVVIKHFSLTVTFLVIGLSMLPLLILLRFWWALEELKDLPDIAGQMLGDAKNEIKESVQGIRSGNIPKLSFLSATKGMWSLGSMLSDSRELLGSYISISTLINPFMLILGVVSLCFVFFLLLVSVGLGFLAIF
jgi:hypothetical protein